MNWKLTNFLLISAPGFDAILCHAQKDASLWLTNHDKFGVISAADSAIAFTTSAATRNLTIELSV